MSALPNWRFQKPLLAFGMCGIDFAGPFELKEAGRGKARPKTYFYLLVFSSFGIDRSKVYVCNP
jgi:hypothetical protein